MSRNFFGQFRTFRCSHQRVTSKSHACKTASCWVLILLRPLIFRPLPLLTLVRPWLPAGKRRPQFLTSVEVREHLRRLWEHEGPLLRLIWAAGQPTPGPLPWLAYLVLADCGSR